MLFRYVSQYNNMENLKCITMKTGSFLDRDRLRQFHSGSDCPIQKKIPLRLCVSLSKTKESHVQAGPIDVQLTPEQHK
jgi:hypothetical protein